MVPGATDDLINVRKKAPKAAAKHVTELPVEPNYEYDLPVAPTKEKEGGDKPSAEELKVRGPARVKQRPKRVWNCCALAAGLWHPCRKAAQRNLRTGVCRGGRGA